MKIIDYAKSMQRRNFDPSSAADLAELRYFRKTSTWKTACPFELEQPFLDIPTMCYIKCTDYILEKITD